MQTLLPSKTEPLSDAAIKLAEASSIALERLLAREEDTAPDAALRVSLELPDGAHADLVVPTAILPLFLSALKELGHGKDVVIIATDTELTTQQAADILKVSRPYFVKLLTEGKIPYRAIGSRRRVLLADLLRYRKSETIARHEGLDELAAEAQRLGMY